MRKLPFDTLSRCSVSILSTHQSNALHYPRTFAEKYFRILRVPLYVRGLRKRWNCAPVALFSRDFAARDGGSPNRYSNASRIPLIHSWDFSSFTRRFESASASSFRVCGGGGWIRVCGINHRPYFFPFPWLGSCLLFISVLRRPESLLSKQKYSAIPPHRSSTRSPDRSITQSIRMRSFFN